mgnify:CR=1 FL=1|jgi:hypothetical protein
MKVTTKEPKNFGDVRSMILDTIVALQSDELDVSRGMAIAANFKVLNDNIFAEIAATKLALATDGKAHTFGQVVRMGQRLITNNAPINSAPDDSDGASKN